MIYEQILSSRGTPKAKIKRAFQILGLLHFIFGITFFVIALFIHWKLALYTLVLFAIGLIWGNLSYLFTADYKYVYKDGVFSAYKSNSHNKFVLVLQTPLSKVKKSQCKNAKKLTNRDKSITVEVEGKSYEITPDNYMLSLIERSDKL